MSQNKRVRYRPAQKQNKQFKSREVVNGLEQELANVAKAPKVLVENFAALNLPGSVIQILNKNKIVKPSPIQSSAIPDILNGRDVLGRAETGSGKTYAFGLPSLVRLYGKKANPGAPLALIMVPTRELAQQVNDALVPVASALNLRITTIYGGASMQRQHQSLKRGVEVDVATPGRLEDHLRQKTIYFKDLQICVLDEADHMAEMGFMPAMTRILDLIPNSSQNLLFSATLDRGVSALVKKYLKEPALHAVEKKNELKANMKHMAFVVEKTEKNKIVAEIAKRPARTLLFVRTKYGAEKLANNLEKWGIEATAIHGDRSQAQRNRALGDFSSGRKRVLVATDVAARGIHVDGVDLVVHVDPPQEWKDYIHRSGRTARAGTKGVALSLLESREIRSYLKMQDEFGNDVKPIKVKTLDPAVAAIAKSGEAVVVNLTQESRPRQNPKNKRNFRRFDRKKAKISQ
ncbi:MAG: DEAD/DEAH box helicase [Candidatus Nanopelagicales bacterium]